MSFAGTAFEVGIIGLFAFLLIAGAMSNRGSQCGRGWLAFLALPLASAVGYVLLNRVISGRQRDAAVAEGGVEEGAKVAGLPTTLMGYAAFLAFAQYLFTVVMVFIQKPQVNKLGIFSRSFLSAAIIFIVTIILIAIKGPGRFITGLIPGKAGDMVRRNQVYALGLNPVLWIASLAAYGISCSTTR